MRSDFVESLPFTDDVQDAEAQLLLNREARKFGRSSGTEPMPRDLVGREAPEPPPRRSG